MKTIMITAAVTAVVTVVTTLLAKLILDWTIQSATKSRGKRWIVRSLRRCWLRFGIWRISKVLVRLFRDTGGIQNLDIRGYKTALTQAQHANHPCHIFAFMNIKQPKVMPKLSDYLIANGIEKLANEGRLVKLPQPQLADVSPVFWGGKPSEARLYTIAYNANRDEAKSREDKSDEERCCMECHAWPSFDACPRVRYSFQDYSETEGNITRYGRKALLDEASGACQRCWENDVWRPDV